MDKKKKKKEAELRRKTRVRAKKGGWSCELRSFRLVLVVLERMGGVGGGTGPLKKGWTWSSGGKWVAIATDVTSSSTWQAVGGGAKR